MPVEKHHNDSTGISQLIELLHLNRPFKVKPSEMSFEPKPINTETQKAIDFLMGKIPPKNKEELLVRDADTF